MKLLQVFNEYRSLFNGEQAVVEQTARLIESRGGQARLLTRSSRDMEPTLSAKWKAAWSGIYSRGAQREMLDVLDEFQPDVVHAHNLYPLLSPSVLVACRQAGVPVVVSVHNQQFTCPTSDHLRHGEICERCLGGGEFQCVLHNCRKNILESVAYAARAAIVRSMRFYHDNVNVMIALSQSAKDRLIRAGFDEEQVVVCPNMVTLQDEPVDPAQGSYAAFAGRLSPEKGIETLLAAARKLPFRPVQLAGDGPMRDRLQARIPINARLLGRLDETQMADLYRGARFFVLPSRAYEMCPLVILEAMSHGLPVITSRVGGQCELVQEEVTGLLFEPGDADDLRRQMQRLWENPELCLRMGRAGYETVQQRYTEDTYYKRLTDIYRRAGAVLDDQDARPLVPAVGEGADRATEKLESQFDAIA